MIQSSESAGSRCSVIIFGVLALFAPASAQVVISQVYGGGQGASALYKNDYVELFNPSADDVSLASYSVQYQPAASTGAWTGKVSLTGTIHAHGYFLVQMSASTGSGTGAADLPTPDYSSTAVSMSAASAKVALVSNTNTLQTAAGPPVACPSPAAGVVDQVGYGAANCAEGTPVALLDASKAAFRNSAGCDDSNNNAADFTIATPLPRNSASPSHACLGSTAPAASGSASAAVPGGATTINGTITSGTNPASATYSVVCDLSPISGSRLQSVNVTSAAFTYNYLLPASTSPSTYTLPCTVSDDRSRSSTFNVTLAVNVALSCESGFKTSTPIHAIQGSGTVSPLAGQTVDAEGIVVGSFQDVNHLKGFYLQEPDATWDSDPLTSEGIFVFSNGFGPIVNIGDRVRVRGVVDEFLSSGSFLGVTQSSSLTEIAALQGVLVCSTGNGFARASISLPTAALRDLERFEGMAVQISQQLTVTGNFSLGTSDQLDLAPSLLYTPTTSADKLTWPAVTNLNARSVIALDDASTLANSNLYPTVYPQGGLTAANTLRNGALVNYDPNSHTNSALAGILDDRFGEYRIQPTEAVAFYNANPRPAIAPVLSSAGGRFRAVSANVLNFFTSFNGRGATSQTEFDHQKTKMVEALGSMDGDVYGLSEVQNFNDGQTGNASNAYTNSAVQSIVDGLNCRKAGLADLCTDPPGGPYAFIDTLSLGSGNGTDAIRSVIIYRTDRLAPVGSPAAWNQNDQNRPTLAQTFQPAAGAKASSQTFTFAVNHFRSKGSACASGNDTYQGNCNAMRLSMAQNVSTWLAGNPTGDPAANRRLLLAGDFNAYLGEDPIQYFVSQDYTDLINTIIGPNAYSYNFGSQAGYLDHALASPAMNSLVKNVVEWHNNADEPSSLQALGSASKSAAAQVAYYAPDPYAASDHDPIVIGFNPLPGDLNDDGVVDAADQKIVQGALGRSASAVDRRIDFDGDGKISINDYRIWTNDYRAFAQ